MKDGAHTHGGGGPDLGPVVMAFIVAAVVFAAVRWAVARPWWELAGAAVVLVAAGAGGWRVRCALRRMRAADQAEITARIQAARAEAFPQVSQVAAPPAIEQHVHYHFGDGEAAARILRQSQPHPVRKELAP